nr:hypothetical protein [Tanacetum cinerariifolium]
MDANKKIDFDNPLCPKESKILANILQSHPLRFNIAASSSVPWIYWGTIFKLPQATDNNHEYFVAAPKFSEMVPVFLNDLGYTLELRLPSKFKTTGLVQPWMTLFKMFLRCLTTFTKLIISHYMTAYPEYLRRIHDKYHNLEHDEMVKSIFNSRKNKARVGMKILSWMITDEMKLTKNYRILCIPPRRSTRPTPPTPILTAAEVEDITLRDTIQLSTAEQKSHDEIEAEKNVEKVEEHLIANEIEKMVRARSYKESPEVEKTIVVSQPVNVIKEEDESSEDDYKLKR